MEIVIKAGISSKSQMFQFITEIFYSCLWPAPRFGRRKTKIKRRGKQSCHGSCRTPSVALCPAGILRVQTEGLMPTISARMGGRDAGEPPVLLQQEWEEPNCTCDLGSGIEEHDRHPLNHISRQTLSSVSYITPALSISLWFGITHKLMDGLGHRAVPSSQFSFLLCRLLAETART